MKRYSFLLFILLFSSCQEEVTLPLAEFNQVIPVIEATWTDISPYNQVKITLAEDYLNANANMIVSDAQVVIKESETNKRIPFEFNEEIQSYIPIRNYDVAKLGKTYTLQVDWDGHKYESEGKLRAPPIVDSLTYEYQEKRLFRSEGYYIKVYGEIPFTQNNFYRIKVIQNDTLKNGREDYLLFDDTFGLSFFEEGLELGYSFEAGDRVRLELYRMNKDAFTYLNQLVAMLFSDGGLFSPPPQNPETNIRVISGDSEVQGYFNVTPVLIRTVAISPK